MKYVFFTTYGTGLPVAFRLQEEGQDVIVAFISDLNDALTDDEKKAGKKVKEEADKKEKRQSLYKGILKKYDAWSVVKYLLKVPDPENYYLFFEINDGFRFSEKLMKRGFKGVFPTQWDRTMEVDRDKARKFVEKYYPDIKLKDVKEFSKTDEAIKLLQESDEVAWVLKAKGDAVSVDTLTVVPKTDDIDANNQQLISALEENKKEYESSGFILQEKIIDPIEITPQMVFLDGEPIYSTIDIEQKFVGAGDVGKQVGCAANLIYEIDIDESINQMAFPKVVYDLAKKRGGLFFWDVSILFDQDGTPYFGEFCPNRYGWDQFVTELDMAESPTSYFESIVKGENPLRNLCGMSVRMFNVSMKNGKLMEGSKVMIDEKIAPHVWMYEMKKDKGKLVTTNTEWDLGAITGSGFNVEEAIEAMYTNAKGVFIDPDPLMRPKFDLRSTAYKTAIMTRYEYGIERGLFEEHE